MSGLAPWPVAIESVGPVSTATVVWRTHGRLRVTVIVKATFELSHERPMRLLSPDAIVAVDAQYSDGSGSVFASSDLAPYLPRADVLFVGSAHAPPGQSMPTSSVRLGVARDRVLVDKTLHVFGDRVVSDNEHPEPAPFQWMPIVYERAARGAGFDENPVGIVPRLGGAMPNIVDPADPEGPAGFGPLAPAWPVRRRLLRGLDPDRLFGRAIARRSSSREAPPHVACIDIPDAFAWSYFHAAPPDQRCPFLRGDEWIVLDGLSPDAQRVTARLPNVRAEARVLGLSSSSPFAEVELCCDTMAIDGDRARCSLVFRGNFPASLEVLPALRVYAGVSVAGSSIPWPERAGGPEVDDEDAATLLITRTQLSAAHARSTYPPDMGEDATPIAQPTLLAELAARSAREGWEGADPETLRRGKESAGRRVAFDENMTIGHDPVSLSELLEQSLREADETVPRTQAPRSLAARQLVERKLAAKESLAGLDLQAADLTGLDLRGRCLAGADLRRATLQGVALEEADLSGANLGGADLSDASLDRANLSRADLYGANVAGASFAAATLTDANLATARGEGARFIGARGERALFGGGRWAFARFDEAELSSADFTEAVLDDACFDRAELREVRLYEARAPGASFTEATMPEARADSANLRRARLDRVFSPDSVWDDANLDDASFYGAMLPGASFVRASCKRADFSAAELAEARLKRARLEGARFVKTDVGKATFEGADLSRADLSGANMHDSLTAQ